MVKYVMAKYIVFKFCQWCLSTKTGMTSIKQLRNNYGENMECQTKIYRYPVWRKGPNNELLCNACYNKHLRRVHGLGVYKKN